MPHWAPLTPKDRCGLALGFAVGIGLLLFGVTVALELTGDKPVGWALALLADSVIVWRLHRANRRYSEGSRLS